MSEYISFGKVIKTVNGIEYDASENYEIVEKGKVEKLEKENEELKKNLKFLVDEIFVGVEFLEGSRVGNYLKWVKNLRKKLKKFKETSDE